MILGSEHHIGNGCPVVHDTPEELFVQQGRGGENGCQHTRGGSEEFQNRGRSHEECVFDCFLAGLRQEVRQELTDGFLDLTWGSDGPL